MEQLMKQLIEKAQSLGVDYADVRHISGRRQRITATNGRAGRISDSVEEGFGLRLLIDGGWGFAATSRMDEIGARQVVDKAVSLAQASAYTVTTPVELSPLKPMRARWKSPATTDPFEVKTEDKLALLRDAHNRMRAAEAPHFAGSYSMLFAYQEEKLFLSRGRHK